MDVKQQAANKEVDSVELEDSDEETSLPSPSKDGVKRYFVKDIKSMLYGFGDEAVPYEETVNLLDDLATNYIMDMTKKAMQIGKQGKIEVNDIVFLIRKDDKKYSRVRELLTLNEELKRARKAWDEKKIMKEEKQTTTTSSASNVPETLKKLPFGGISKSSAPSTSSVS